MATDHNFKVKNGLSVGDTEIIDVSGNLTNIPSITVTGSTSDEDAIRTVNGRIQLGHHSSGAGIWLDSSDTSQYWFAGLSGTSFRLYRNGNKFTLTDTGNATFAGTIASGEITVSGNSNGIKLTGGNNRIYFSGYRALEGATDGGILQVGEGYSTVTSYGHFNLTSGHAYQVNGTTVIDSSRNLTNIGTISSGTITSSGNIIATGTGAYVQTRSLILENQELTDMNTAYQMVFDANDSGSDVPGHGNHASSYPFGVYILGDNGGTTTTLGSGLVKLWHTGHFSKDHIDYFVGLYDGTQTLSTGTVQADTFKISSDTEHTLSYKTTSAISGATTDTTELKGRQIDLYAYDNIYFRAGTADSIYLWSGGSATLTLDSSHNATFEGSITASTLRLTSTGDASVSSTTHALQIGPDSSANVIFDDNEIMARSNGSTATLNLNPDGGSVTINSNSGGGAIWHSGNLSPLTTSTSFGGDVSGTYNAIVVANDSHTHAFNNLTSKTSGTGDYKTTGKFRASDNIVSGEGSGGVALTINDSKGNANVTFNHADGVPEQNGNAARIEVNTDSSTGAHMYFELKSGVTGGTSVDLTPIMSLDEDGLNMDSSMGISINGTTRINSVGDGLFTSLYIGSTNIVDTSRNLTNIGSITQTGASGSYALNVYHATTNVVARFESGDDTVWIDLHDNNSGTYGCLLGHNSTDHFMITDNAANTIFKVGSTGNVFTPGSSITVDPASGDAVLYLQGAAGAQTLRIDQNSIRSSTNSPITFLTNSTSALLLGTDQSVDVTTGNFKVGGTTVITSARALDNITGLDLAHSTSQGVNITATDSTADATFYAARIDHNISGSDTLTADRTHTGLFIDMDSSATGGDTANEHRLYGIQVDVRATGDSDLMHAGYFYAESQHSAGQVTDNVGVYGFAVADDTGTGHTANNIGGRFYAYAYNSGTGGTTNHYGVFAKTLLTSAADKNTNSATGVYAEVEVDTSGTTTTLSNAYVFQAQFDNDASDTTTNNAYLFYGNYAGTLPNTAYGVYIADAVDNYFGGSVRTATGFKIANTFVIDDGRNLTNINAATIAQDVTIGGSSDAARYISINKAASGENGILFKNAGSNKIKILQDASEHLRIYTNNTGLRMSILEGGSVLVGKSAEGSSNVGVELRQDGYLFATGESIPPLRLNRTTSNGDIAEFRYDNSLVGTMGIEGGDSLYIQAGTTTGSGLRFHPTSGVISPVRNGTISDGTISLGTSTQQFNNLHLNGTAYIAGAPLNNSSHRSGLLNLSDYGGSWTGFMIARDEGDLWAIMGNGADFGLYDDLNSKWIILHNQSSYTQHYHNGTEILRTHGDGVKAYNSYISKGIGDGNTTPGTDEAEFNGYGLIGNRGTFYITNGGGTVQIGNGTTHNSDPTCTFSTAAVNLASGVALQTNGTTVIDSSRNLTNIGTITATGGGHTFSGGTTTFNVGRGDVYFENNTNSNASGAGITLRTSSNPGSDDGSIFDVRSSGQAIRFYVGQDLTSSGTNPFYVGCGSSSGQGTASDYSIELATNGDIIAEGNITAYGSASDIRLKENIEPITNALNKIKRLDGVTFNYKKDGSRSTGVIAQQVQEVLPEVIYESAEVGKGEDGEKFLAVRYGQMMGLAIEAIKEQQEKIEKLEELVQKLISEK